MSDICKQATNPHHHHPFSCYCNGHDGQDASPVASFPAGFVQASLHSLAIGTEAARCQDDLMDAIAAPEPSIVTVRHILATIREDLRQSVLLCPSSSTRHQLRTPLMAAAATSEMPIVGEQSRHAQIAERREVL